MSWVKQVTKQDVRVVVAASTDEEILTARRLHAEVYVKRGFLTDGVNWLDLNSGLIEDPWVISSDYVAVVEGEQPIGVARLLRPDPALGLPALTNFEISPDYRWVQADQCREISSFTIGGKSTIYSGVFAQLFRGLLKVMAASGERYWVGIVERPLLRIMQRYYQLPFEIMGEGRRYMGGETVPVILDVVRFITGLDDERFQFLTRVVDDETLQAWLNWHLQSSSKSWRSGCDLTRVPVGYWQGSSSHF